MFNKSSMLLCPSGPCVGLPGTELQAGHRCPIPSVGLLTAACATY